MRESYRLVKAVLRMEVSLNHIETVLELIREQQQNHALPPAEKEDRWCNIADIKQMFQISDSTIYER